MRLRKTWFIQDTVDGDGTGAGKPRAFLVPRSQQAATPWGSHAEGVQGSLSCIEQARLLGQSDTLSYGTRLRTQTERDVGTPVDGQAESSFPLGPLIASEVGAASHASLTSY